MRGAGRIAGVGLAFCLEPSGAGWESARVTLRADGSVLVASGSSSQGQGRETSYAQIAADALGVGPSGSRCWQATPGPAPRGSARWPAAPPRSAAAPFWRPAARPRRAATTGEPLPITVETRYDNLGQAWGAGVYLALVEIDAESGAMTVLKAHATSDAGLIVNPLLVEGQMQGGFAQGLGEAVMENLVLDDTGQLLTGSFMDYAMPRATTSRS
jgi:carbon-monoxide dehydrogenase large subunit